jgi:iron(III) transport system ATP-binding protein
MSQGRIEQVGEPWAIYESPATLGIARFVGDLVELPVNAVDGSVAQTPVGPVAVGGEPPTSAGGVLTLRPEQLVLVADRQLSNDVSGASGRVEAISYHGHDSLTSVRLTDGTPVSVRSTGGSGLRVGDDVRILVTGAGRLYPDE